MHTDAQQTAELHAIPAFAAWARARGFRVGDWVLAKDGRELLVHTLDSLGAEGTRPSYNRADCRLMASEADLTAFLQTQCHRLIVESYTDEVYVRLENPGGRLAGGLAIWYHTVTQGHADTRIGALVATCKAVEGGE